MSGQNNYGAFVEWNTIDHKKVEKSTLWTAWMDLENIILSEINQSRDGQITYDFTHMWNLMNKLN